LHTSTDHDMHNVDVNDHDIHNVGVNDHLG
jgi:hypothetical protein